MKQLIIFIILFYCVNYVWHEHRKTLVQPGNMVIYKGKIHSIEELKINTVTNLKMVKLDSLNSKSLPADSVKNNYRPFWKSLFASNN
jgi:hypothetical protein